MTDSISQLNMIVSLLIVIIAGLLVIIGNLLRLRYHTERHLAVQGTILMEVVIRCQKMAPEISVCGQDMLEFGLIELDLPPKKSQTGD